MRYMLTDLRYGFRMLVRHPTLSVAAIFTFGLGIGLTTTAFSVVNGGLFKGLPFRDADRVVAIGGMAPSRDTRRAPLVVQDVADLQERQTVFESIGALRVAPINLIINDGSPQRFSAAELTAGAATSIGVTPLLGRMIGPGDDEPGAADVIVVGYDVWRDQLDGDPNVLGRTVRANGVTRTIVGVMPERFGFPVTERLWIPLVADPLASQRGQAPTYRVVARLKPDVSIEEAQAQVSTIFAQLEQEHPTTNDGLGAVVLPYAQMVLGPEIYGMLYTMLAAGLGVLIIACVNVSNLLLARSSLRSREVAVRLAMGAGRTRIVSQLLAEVSVLAVAGAALGAALSVVAMRWFISSLTVVTPPFWISFELDYRILVFGAGVTLLASLLAGLFPALQTTRTDVATTIKDDSRGSTGLRLGRFSGALVVAEVAVSCTLLVVAGLMVRSIVQLRNQPMPFAVDNVLTARINLPRLDYPDDPSCVRFYEELLPRLEAVAGVEAATLSDGLPAAGNGSVAVAIEGHEYASARDYPFIREGIVTPGYFETFRTPIREGRSFTAFDDGDAPLVAIVNESFVRAHVPDGSPIGRRFKKRPTEPANPWLTIVGVVPDLLMQGIGNRDQNPAGYYIPIGQSDVTNFVTMAVRSASAPGSLTSGIRSAVADLDPNLAIYDVRTMEDVIVEQTWFYWVFGTFFMVFGGIALCLAIAGLYGVVSFSVTQRTREMGIRTALGASGAGLIRLVMRRSTTQLAIGLGLGVGLAALVSGPLQPLLYQVNPRDGLVLGVVPVVLALAGLAAAFLPARRAAAVDPVVALTAE